MTETSRPSLSCGEVGFLTVRNVNRVGAFLKWDEQKDLLLPFGEQTRSVQSGERVLAAVFQDEAGRFAATMNVYPYLRTDSPYHTDDQVHGTVYETSENFGTFVAVDDRYSALIPRKELVTPLAVGTQIEARVLAVRPDGKLTLSLRDKSWKQMAADADILLARLQAENGFLPLTDKSDPDRIREMLHMSKSQFKRAVGRLYKERRIALEDQGIRLI